jgi:hypothetical protein
MRNARWPRLGAGVAAGATALLMGSSLGPGSVSAMNAGTEQSCKSHPGSTLRSSASLRVFATISPAGGRGIFVCAEPDGASHSVGGTTGKVGLPFALSESWVAAEEERGRPQDEFIRDVVARDARSGALNRCRIGASNRPGQLLRVSAIVVTEDGAIGWSGRERLGYREPVVGTCIQGTNEIVGRGQSVAVGSLKLEGRVLSWSNGGQRESSTL